MSELINAFRQKLMLQIRASHGIGAPYGDYEQQMMAAGHKPTLIASPKLIEPALQEAIDNGTVVQVQTTTLDFIYRFYCAHQHLQMAQYLSGLYQQLRAKPETVAPEDHQMCREYFQKALTPPGKSEPDKSFWSYADIATDEEVKSLLDGHVSILPKPQRYHPQLVNKALEEAVRKNKITFSEMYSTEIIAVYAQTNKIEEGKELAARYWHNEEGYQSLPDKELLDRIGALLGYTKRDTDYFGQWQRGEINPAEQKIYDETADSRREARMKLISTKWPEYTP
jgi:hypothetical protein